MDTPVVARLIQESFLCMRQSHDMNKLTRIFLTLFLAANVSFAAADHHGKKDKKHDHKDHTAVVVLQPTSEATSAVSGMVWFKEMGKKVKVTGWLKGLEPNSTHGFHIHQFGDLSKDDGTSAGGHFNPHDKPHAGPGDKEHHAGDLGNVTADANGEVKLDFEADWLQVCHGPHAVLGRAVVLHAGADDLKSQPSGDAGSRIGIGVIGWGNTESK